LSGAQNLIQNPSFEEHKKCSKSFTKKQLKLKGGVMSTKGTPDYFHNCSKGFSPENNPFGIQQPYEGDAFCGLTITSDYIDECANREYLQLKFIEPLKAGNKYLFSVKVSLADTSGYYTDQIGVHFYNESFSKKQSIRSFMGKASINNLADTFLIDSEGWTKLSGVYNAKGGEQYMMLGNFQKCNQTTRKAVLPNGMADSLKKYEDKNAHKGYQPSPNVLNNMKRKFKEDISGSILQAYNLAYYFVDDLSLTPFTLNDSLSFLTSEEACSKQIKRSNNQNLIRDGAFYLNKENKNPYWKTASKGTPDFLKNQVGLYLYSAVGKNNREYIITELKEQLSPCKTYSFSVSVRRNSAYKFAVDQLQLAAIDTSHFANNRMIFSFDPVYTSPSNHIIEDTENWIRLCGEFTPRNCSKYVVIGNFSDDDETYILPVELSGKDGPYAYYFVDEVELFEVDSSMSCVEPCQAKIEKGKELTKEDTLEVQDRLQFYFESSSIYAMNHPNRNQFTKFIEAIEKDSLLEIVIEGHADKSGNEIKNERLSKMRAAGIYKYLIQIEVPKERLRREYFGSKNPKVSNNSPKGRAINRRVEVYLSKKIGT